MGTSFNIKIFDPPDFKDDAAFLVDQLLRNTINVSNAVKSVNEVNDVKVDLVWDPPWDMSRMSDVARLELDMM